jgi:Tfp pilus assembly protein PilX
MEKTTKERGVALFLTVLIMSVILAIGLGISGIIIQQIKISGNIGDSVVAFYTADSGVEYQIFNLYKEETHNPPYNVTFDDNGASYSVSAVCSDNDNITCPVGIPIVGKEECSSLNNFCIKSIGTFQTAKRAIEVNY